MSLGLSKVHKSRSNANTGIAEKILKWNLLALPILLIGHSQSGSLIYFETSSAFHIETALHAIHFAKNPVYILLELLNDLLPLIDILENDRPLDAQVFAEGRGFVPYTSKSLHRVTRR